MLNTHQDAEKALIQGMEEGGLTVTQNLMTLPIFSCLLSNRVTDDPVLLVDSSLMYADSRWCTDSLTSIAFAHLRLQASQEELSLYWDSCK